jgi:hypothetical protein
VTRPTRSRPRFAAGTGPLRFAVEGVGDVIRHYYEPAFRALRAGFQGRRAIEVTFVDNSAFWKQRNDPRLIAKMNQIIQSVRGWGADYLDKSDAADLARYRPLEPDVVIIATPDTTHVGVAGEWLKRPRRPEQIFLEKPLADSLGAARRLLGMVPPYDEGILAFDHYRARLLPSRTQLGVLLGFLGEGPWRLRFYFLEDHSGADPNYPPARAVGRDGPIENEQRVVTLRHGLVLDGLPHLIAVLATFGRVETLRPTRVYAGQYAGVDGDPEKRTEIDRETFAEVRFVCANHAGERIDGVAWVGKGVRGVRELGPEYDHNVKLLEIETQAAGREGNRVRFDLRSSGPGSSRAYLIDAAGRTQLEFALYPSPYHTFLEKVADGTYRDDELALPVEVGKSILAALEDVRDVIPERSALPAYPSGLGGIRDALYLEDVLQCLGNPVWGV